MFIATVNFSVGLKLFKIKSWRKETKTNITPNEIIDLVNDSK